MAQFRKKLNHYQPDTLKFSLTSILLKTHSPSLLDTPLHLPTWFSPSTRPQQYVQAHPPSSTVCLTQTQVTSEPSWFDLEGGVRKTIDFINEASQAGCKLVAFPEVWIPGYPYWMWKVNYQQSLPMLKKYRENSMAVDSEEFRRIRRAARDNQMFVPQTSQPQRSATKLTPLPQLRLPRLLRN